MVHSAGVASRLYKFHVSSWYSTKTSLIKSNISLANLIHSFVLMSSFQSVKFSMHSFSPFIPMVEKWFLKVVKYLFV